MTTAPPLFPFPLPPSRQVSALKVLASMAFASETTAQQLLTSEMLSVLVALAADDAAGYGVQLYALRAVGDLALCEANRRMLLAAEGLKVGLPRYDVLFRVLFCGTITCVLQPRGTRPPLCAPHPTLRCLLLRHPLLPPLSLCLRLTRAPRR